MDGEGLTSIVVEANREFCLNINTLTDPDSDLVSFPNLLALESASGSGKLTRTRTDHCLALSLCQCHVYVLQIKFAEDSKKLLHGLLKVDLWIFKVLTLCCQNHHMYLFMKLLDVFFALCPN